MPPALRARLCERIESGALDLPLLPEVTQEVLAMTADDGCDPRRLAGIIRRDQALASHLLRVANSPLYLSPVPIVSLQQAINRLGILAIRQIAILITCQTRTFQVAGYERDVHQLFQHSLAAALFAQEIGRVRRLNVEEAFLGGLLHDVGRPVLLQALLDMTRGDNLGLAPGALASAIDEFHARVGAELAARWALPARLCETLQFHHRPQDAPQSGAPLVALADDLAHLLTGPKAVSEDDCRQHPALPMLKIYPDEIDGILRRRTAIQETMKALA